MCVRERPAVPHSDQGEKLVEHIVCVNRKASTPQIAERDLPPNYDWGEIKAQDNSPIPGTKRPLGHKLKCGSADRTHFWLAAPST